MALEHPGPLPGSWQTSELGQRTLSALVLGSVVLLTTVAGGWPFALLWCGAATAFCIEWVAMTAIRSRRAVLGAMVGGIAVSQLVFGLGGPFATVATILACTGIVALAARGGTDRVWAVGGFLVGCSLAIVPFLLRSSPDGLVAVLWMFAVVWGTDIAAFFVGRRFGGPRLWPAVSPGKTWSGAAGGLAVGTAAGTLLVLLVDRTGPEMTFFVLLASAAASIASQFGDLGESAMKRRFGLKDSGNLIPGHGGIMDRLDGFAAVALMIGSVAVVFALFQALPGAPRP